MHVDFKGSASGLFSGSQIRRNKIVFIRWIKSFFNNLFVRELWQRGVISFYEFIRQDTCAPCCELLNSKNQQGIMLDPGFCSGPGEQSKKPLNSSMNNLPIQYFLCCIII